MKMMPKEKGKEHSMHRWSACEGSGNLKSCVCQNREIMGGNIA
jgi:hypothetical protein